MGDQMRTYKVTTPSADFSGEVGGVHFVRGEATVIAPAPLAPLPYDDDEGSALTRRDFDERELVGNHPNYRAMAYFRQAGYGIEDITPDDTTAAAEDTAAADETPSVLAMPAKNGSTEDWRAYAIASGMPEDEANAKTRDELVARYTTNGGAL